MLCLVARFKDDVLRYPIPSKDSLIGSSEENHLLLPFPGVSRTHARVRPVDGGILFTDLGSKNKLMVNAERHDEYLLIEGMALQLGRAILTIEEASTSDVELALSVHRTGGANDRISAETGENFPAENALPSPALALQLIREIESAPRTARRKLNEILHRARTLIESESLMILDAGTSVSAETFRILVSDGEVPADTVLDELELITAEKRFDKQVVRSGGGFTLVVTPAGKKTKTGFIAAVFNGKPASIEPWKKDLLLYLARRAFGETAKLPEPLLDPGEETLVLPEQMVVGESQSMHRLLAQIRATVRSTMDVLLEGETGTGKELLARMIHASGPSSKGRFVAINCAAIPSELLEAELFGVHARVATGVDPRTGLFVEADGGSILLDEVGELPDRLQAKLLRVLQEREVLPLGAATPRKITVRVIAASNRDLLALVESGNFRRDVYYRLRGLQFHIPPLRERREDIPALVLDFVTRHAERYNKTIHGVSRKALRLLMEHDWPGNVRELQSEVERAVLVCPDGGSLQVDHFGPVRWSVEHRTAAVILPATESSEPPPQVTRQSSLDIQTRVDSIERELILEALKTSRGNKTIAAKLLGITRNGLAMKMARLKIGWIQ